MTLERTPFVINVRPFGKQRHRTSRGRTYTPPKTIAYEKLIAREAALHFERPYNGPVSVDVVAIFKPAKSWSKKKTALAMGQPHTQKPDADNLMKAILDGMNGVAYVDDSQVSDEHCVKEWGPEDKLVITVKRIHTLLD